MAALAGLAACSAAGAQDFDYDGYEGMFDEPVTLGATGMPLRESEAPATVTIISHDEIAASPAADIAGLLRYVAGLDSARRTIGQVDIAVRGYNSPVTRGVLVLVNGRQVYLDYAGATNWEAIPIQIEEIRQIEVIRGPNGPLYGFNAAQGVINIVTDNPLYDTESFATAQFGSQADRRVSAGFSAPIGERGGVRVTVGQERSEEFTEGYPDADALQTDRKRLAANADIALRLTEDLTGRLELGYADVDHSQIGVLYNMADRSPAMKSIKLDLTRAQENGHVGATAYFNRLDVNVFTNDVAVAQAELLRILNPRHTLRLSGEVRRDEASQRGPGIDFDIGYRNVSGAAMWAWEPLDALSFTNAVRVDQLELEAGEPPPGVPFAREDYDRSFTETSFNSTVMWRATPTDQLRVTVARGVQLPSLVDWGLAAGVPDGEGGTLRFIGGTPQNDIATAWSYEIGWRRRVAPLNAAFEAVVFHTRREHIIGSPGFVPDAFAPGPVYLLTDRGDTQADGVELSLEGAVADAWRWNVNYTNLDVDDDLTVSQPYSPVAFAPAQPTHVANGVVTYDSGRLLATLAGHYQSDTAELALTPGGFAPQQIDAFLDLDARLDVRLSDTVAVGISGLGLLDETQKQTSVGETERRLFFTLRLRR